MSSCNGLYMWLGRGSDGSASSRAEDSAFVIAHCNTCQLHAATARSAVIPCSVFTLCAMKLPLLVKGNLAQGKLAFPPARCHLMLTVKRTVYSVEVVR